MCVVVGAPSLWLCLFMKVDEAVTQEFDVEGHDLLALLYAYLDEFLYRFSVEGFVCKKATLLELQVPTREEEEEGVTTATATATTALPAESRGGGEEGGSACRLRVRGQGETFNLEK